MPGFSTRPQNSDSANASEIAALLPNLQSYRVVVEPDNGGEGHWAGAPSIVYDSLTSLFWLAYRTDRPGQSQSAIHLACSVDGAEFTDVRHFTCAELEANWLERPALLRDEHSGLFKLYLCLENRSGEACIFKMEDIDDPADFDPATTYAVLKPLLHCSGWHNFHTRIACAWPTDQAIYLVYEGSNVDWYQPEFHLQTGLAITHDFRSMTDLTPDAPLLGSPTPGQYATLRYLCYAIQGSRVLWYYEAARPDGAFDLMQTEVQLSEER